MSKYNNQSVNVQAYKHYQSDEVQDKQQAMEDFIFWLEYDAESPEIEKSDLLDLKSLINSYLDIDMDKVKAGEQEILKNWIGEK